ncbi:putative oxidoreductase dhs-27 isoform X1 [Osmia lignaria lignaria]|uniref:putative oxidoreductase dhs-27 isoform X1 n=2 Tax=Osmia lignaria lignaria TaxID=1437193 RepID=UPI00402BCD83
MANWDWEDTDWDWEDTEDCSCEEEQKQIISEPEIDKEWLGGILREFHKEPVTITECNVSPGCMSNESALSAIIRVKVKYTLNDSNSTQDLSLIVKELPKDAFSRFFVIEGQFDLREIKFYTRVMPDLKEFQKKQLADKGDTNEEIVLSVPVCYHAHYTPAEETDDSPTTPDSILVLHDLRDSAFRNIKFREGLTYDQTKVALDAIARIHAHSLAMKVIEEQHLSERYPFLFQTAKATDSYQQLVERGLPQLAKFLKSTPGLEAILEALLVLRPKTKHIISALLAPEGPLALITHTDFWCNNLLFKEGDNGLECCILDWQMVTYSRPTNDIALLLVSSLPTELRRKHTDTFLEIYWDALTSTCSRLGVDIPKDLGYTREELNKDYRRSQLLALLLCIGSVDVALGDPETEQRLIDVLKDLHNEGVLTDETVIATSENNP